jgi:hypothetical protein
VGVTHTSAPLDPAEIAGALAGFDRPWWIAGGVGLDLWLGRATRPHGDVDVVLLRRDQSVLREHLADWDLHYVTADHALAPWDGVRLELPVHEIWGRRTPAGPWQVEFLLNEAQADRWLYRRDPSVSLPLDRAGADRGVPVLAPEIVLLYKAKEPRDRDEADFSVVAPQLGPEQRSWLHAAIASVQPSHPWLTRLDGE